MSVQIWTRVSPETQKALDAKAEQVHRNRAEFVKLAIEYVLSGDKSIAAVLNIPNGTPHDARPEAN